MKTDAANGAQASLILAVGRDQAMLGQIIAIFSRTYRVKTANSASAALRVIAEDELPDLVLVETVMPRMDGFALCETLRDNERTRAIPVILLTYSNGVADIRRGLGAGAVDLVSKPICAEILQSRVRTHLNLKSLMSPMKGRMEAMKAVATTATATNATQAAAFEALTAISKMRSIAGDSHASNTQQLTALLAIQLANHPSFCSTLTEANIGLIAKAAPLHDIGKMGIPDHILSKSGRLSPDEYLVMKTHTVLGYQAMVQAGELLGDGNVLKFGCEIALNHHERWNGTGYPGGLSGADIPISARIMAVTDVYDDFIGDRLYKEAKPHSAAVTLIDSGRGTYFDPDVVDAFHHVADQFEQIEFDQASKSKRH
jgi:putative two-component system response regulator